MKQDLICYPTRFGKLVHHHHDKMIGASLKIYGEWAPGETALFTQLINKGDYILDLGANIGFHTLFFSLETGNEGRVIAFEPERKNHQILQFNIVINNLQNVTIYNCLAGIESKIVTSWKVKINPENRGDAIFELVNDDHLTKNTEPLAQIALDTLCLERCDLIKIDVQGFELDVFIGARQLIKSLRPLIFFEQNDEINFREIMTILEQNDYVSYWYVSKAYPKFNIHGEQHDIFKGETEKNIFAVPIEKQEQFPFLSELLKITDKQYNPPALSQLSDSYTIKTKVITEIDKKWVHLLNGFLCSNNGRLH